MPKLVYLWPEGEPFYIPDEEDESTLPPSFKKPLPSIKPEPSVDWVSDAVANLDQPLPETPLPPPDITDPMPDYANVVAERASRRRAGLEADRERAGTADYGASLAATIDRAIEPQRQIVRGALDTVAAVPYDMAASVLSLAGTPAVSDALSAVLPPLKGLQPFATQENVDWLRSQSDAGRRLSELVTGAKTKDLNPLERLSQIGGESALPGQKAASALVAGARFGLEKGGELASQIPTEPLTALANLVVGPAEATRPKKVPTAVVPVDPVDPNAVPLPRSPNRKPRTRGRIEPEPDPATDYSMENPNLVPIDTVGGPTGISTSELKTIGGMAAVSIGMIFAPRLYRSFKLNLLPPLRNAIPALQPAGPRPVSNAAPGTEAISTPGDLARTYDNVSAGVINIMRRAGMPVAALDRVAQTMRIQTRATANAMADSAVNVGRMETPNFTFQARVPLAELAKIETQPVRDYLHVLNTIDDIKMASMTQKSMRNQAQVPVPIIRDMTLLDAMRLKRSLEQANPEVVDIARAYRDNVKAMRKFEVEGEYATLTLGSSREPNTYRWLNIFDANHVPFRGGRVTGEAVERGSAVQSLAETMRFRLTERMQNEVKGLVVDETRRVMPSAFVRVTSEELTANPHWKVNTVTIRRRGAAEHYTTDPLMADVLRMDPYYMSGMAQQLAYSTKRALEITTTGELAPWFAPTSLLRNWWLAKVATPEGRQAPSLLGSFTAVPKQLYPQVANAIAKAIDNGSVGWFSNVLGPANLQALSTRLALVYDRSMFAQLETVGGGRGSILQQQIDVNNRLTQAIKGLSGPVVESGRAFLEAYRALLNSMHNAPMYDYALKNRGRTSLPMLASEARGLTGDPRIGGEYYTKAAGSDRPHAIRYINKQSRLSQTAGKAIRAYGAVTELGRSALPWFNTSVQGIKRVGEAYLANPAKFVTQTWLYQLLPAAAVYLGARALGNDPNGTSYVDYMMNRRSEYDKLMNVYIPVPGLPAEHGIKIPRAHEFAMPSHLAEVAMDHAFRSNIFTEQEDFMAAFKGAAGIVFDPSSSPVENLILAKHGMSGGQGMFAGESYQKRQDPYDQTGGLPGAIELYMRAVLPGLGDVIGQGAAAFIQTPESYVSALGNFMRASSRRVVEKTPVLRDTLGIHPPISGNTQISEELYKKQKLIRDLIGFYRTWDPTKGSGLIGRKPRSKEGEIMTQTLLGERPPGEAAGINQPEPTNPLYVKFMEDMYARFAKDAPYDRKGNETGAVGFLSLWNRHGIAARQLARIRKVNEGNYTTWQDELNERPEQVDYLKRNKVDPTNISQVRNFYEKQRQDTAKVILQAIRAGEEDFSKRIGQPFRIENLNPYGKGMEAPGPLEAVPTEF